MTSTQNPLPKATQLLTQNKAAPLATRSAPAPASTADSTLLLTREVRELTKEIARLKDMDFMQVFNRPIKFFFYSFMKGLMVGLGSVLGASVLVALLIYLLTKISFVPIVGDFVKDIVQQIQVEQIFKSGQVSQSKAPQSSTQNLTP